MQYRCDACGAIGHSDIDIGKHVCACGGVRNPVAEKPCRLKCINSQCRAVVDVDQFPAELPHCDVCTAPMMPLRGCPIIMECAVCGTCWELEIPEVDRCPKCAGIPKAEIKVVPPPANSRQPGGTHYITKKIQPWDFIDALDLSFIAGNVVKYVCRYRDKDGLKDLEKAKHYLEKLIEVETAKRNQHGNSQ